MLPDRVFRRCAALIAAYAVALQAVLSAFAAVPAQARTAGPAFELCVSDASGRPSAPRPHETCGACLAGHCGAGASAPPAAVAAALLWPAFAIASLAPSRRVDVQTARPRDEPHSPRAPPLS
jgi:hypothetical protein